MGVPRREGRLCPSYRTEVRQRDIQKHRDNWCSEGQSETGKASPRCNSDGSATTVQKGDRPDVPKDALCRICNENLSELPSFPGMRVSGIGWA